MSSTYTLNNGIELIGTGEQSGTWGATTNTNFELLDTALDGQVSVTLAATGSSGSPNTLPISDGASSNGRNRLVIFNDGTDLGGTAYVQLTPNDAEKIIYVRNNLSGSRSILLFQGTYSASNDYEVPAGTTAVVFFNGAGSGAVAANVFNNAHFDNLNIAGDVTIGDDLSLNSDGAIINIGADADLQVTHSGSAGTITNATGNLTIDTTASDTDIIFKGTDGASDITALTLDMSEAGRAIFNAALLSNDTNDIRKAQITTQFDSSSFLRLHPSATTDSGGYTNMFFGTSTDNNYGVAIGGLRAGSDSTPSFRIRTHNDSINGVDVLTINNSGVSTFRSGAVFNNNGDDADFQVKSVNNANMLFVNAALDSVGINETTPDAKLHITTGTNSGTGLQIETGLDNGSSSDPVAVNITQNGGTVSEGVYPWYASIGGAQRAYQFVTRNGASAGAKVIHAVQDAGNTMRTRMEFTTSETTFNEGAQPLDFRIESQYNQHMFFLDADQGEIGINTSTPSTTLEVNGNFRPTYFTPHSPTSQTSSNNNNYWKLGNMYLVGPSGAEIVMHGAKPGYSSGGTNVGKLTILLRGGTNASLLDAVFYAEGDTSSVPCQSVRYVPNGNYEFEIYVQLGNYTSVSHTVVTGGSWTENVVNTGSTSAPNNSVGIPTELSTWLGPNEVMTQTQTMTTINETDDDHDFRVESATNAHALLVDAGEPNGGDILFGVSSRAGMYNGTGSNGVAIEKLGDQGTTLVVQSSTNSCMYLSNPSGNSNDNFIIFSDAGATVGSITGTSSGTTYNTTSDRRLKTDIQPIANGTEKLMAMNPVSHKWIADPEADAVHGFIAQEMQDVVPEAVSGEPDGEEMMSMDYGRITPVLVAALQDAHNKITALEKRLVELEAN